VLWSPRPKEGESHRPPCQGGVVAIASRCAQLSLSRERRTYCPPFDDPAVVEGNSSIIHELEDQLDEHGVTALAGIVCSVGGGGLLAGILRGMEDTGLKGASSLTALVLSLHLWLRLQQNLIDRRSVFGPSASCLRSVSARHRMRDARGGLPGPVAQACMVRRWSLVLRQGRGPCPRRHHNDSFFTRLDKSQPRVPRPHAGPRRAWRGRQRRHGGRALRRLDPNFCRCVVATSPILRTHLELDLTMLAADDHAFLVEPACAVAIAPVYEPVILRAAIPSTSFASPGLAPPKHAPSIVVIVCGGNAMSQATLALWEADFAGRSQGAVVVASSRRQVTI
jgi:hypothetical protein